MHVFLRTNREAAFISCGNVGWKLGKAFEEAGRVLSHCMEISCTSLTSAGLIGGRKEWGVDKR